MKTVGEQLLRDPDIQPSGDAISNALKDANKAYLKFVSELANHDIQVHWRYYTDGKAWLAKGVYHWVGTRGGQKETTVLWLSIWDGFFKVTIFIPEKVREAAHDLPLDIEIKQMIIDSKQMGKLKFFPLVFDVCSEDKLKDIYLLADFRKDFK